MDRAVKANAGGKVRVRNESRPGGQTNEFGSEASGGGKNGKMA